MTGTMPGAAEEKVKADDLPRLIDEFGPGPKRAAPKPQLILEDQTKYKQSLQAPHPDSQLLG